MKGRMPRNMLNRLRKHSGNLMRGLVRHPGFYAMITYLIATGMISYLGLPMAPAAAVVFVCLALMQLICTIWVSVKRHSLATELNINTDSEVPDDENLEISYSQKLRRHNQQFNGALIDWFWRLLWLICIPEAIYMLVTSVYNLLYCYGTIPAMPDFFIASSHPGIEMGHLAFKILAVAVIGFICVYFIFHEESQALNSIETKKEKAKTTKLKTSQKSEKHLDPNDTTLNTQANNSKNEEKSTVVNPLQSVENKKTTQLKTPQESAQRLTPPIDPSTKVPESDTKGKDVSAKTAEPPSQAQNTQLKTPPKSAQELRPSTQVPEPGTKGKTVSTKTVQPLSPTSIIIKA